ncbi:MAG TPA: cob(I)yrinic acid a,c-diamide adenosyltransferase [Acholeplasmataceae bacterium]|nr:cob(I)yrinic acid a,c-diamide adenosyltransferase [Acholeplasmataceae bacterium]
MKIYSKEGDNLKTKTLNNKVYKDDYLIEVSGTIDEVQAYLMVIYNHINDEEIKKILFSICKDLFTLSYNISINKAFPEEKTIELESIIDDYENMLTPLDKFIMPGQTKDSSLIHVARTVVRRCERVIVTYARKNNVHKEILKYINRLSDLLFIIARYIEESPNN